MTMTDTMPDEEIVIDVLSIAKGDMRLVLTSTTDEERAKSTKVIEDLFKAGYTIFVETDAGLRRVKKYNPKRQTYVIVDTPSTTASKPTKEIPAKGTRTKAVGATAGG